MNTRNIIGHKIVAVKQQQIDTGRGFNKPDMCNHVQFLLLDNGIKLIPYTIETEDDYLQDFQVMREKR